MSEHEPDSILGLVEMLGPVLELKGAMALIDGIKSTLDGGLLVLRLSIERGEDALTNPEKLAEVCRTLCAAVGDVAAAIDATSYDGDGDTAELRAKLAETIQLHKAHYNNRIDELLAKARTSGRS